MASTLPPSRVCGYNSFFRGSSQFEIHEKAKMDDAFHQRLRVALQKKGLADSGSTTDCLDRLGASSMVKAKKRKHHPGASAPEPSMSLQDA
eukprot:4316723-Prymnesium_polylepis.1